MPDNRNTLPVVASTFFPWSDEARALVRSVIYILCDPAVAEACCGRNVDEIRDVLMARAGPIFAKFKRENNL